MSPEEARAAMRFTEQTLRLLFEVPGEIAKLEAEAESSGQTDDQESSPDGDA